MQRAPIPTVQWQLIHSYAAENSTTRAEWTPDYMSYLHALKPLKCYAMLQHFGEIDAFISVFTSNLSTLLVIVYGLLTIWGSDVRKCCVPCCCHCALPHSCRCRDFAHANTTPFPLSGV